MFIPCYHSFLDNKFLFGVGGGVIQRAKGKNICYYGFCIKMNLAMLSMRGTVR